MPPRNRGPIPRYSKEVPFLKCSIARVFSDRFHLYRKTILKKGIFRTFPQHLEPNLGYNKPVPHTRYHISVLTTLVILALLGAACSAEATPVDTPTPTLQIITATLPPTQTPRPSATPEPPTPSEPVDPVEGQSTSQLNVRSAPSAESDLLGTLQIFAKVQIVGKDPTGTWWLIVYPDSPTGTGWITAQFVQVTGTENVPVFNGSTQGEATPPATVVTSETETGPNVPPGSAPPLSPATPLATQSLAIAFEDGDSSQSPAVSIALSKASVRTFTYNSELSSPQGDLEDWVQFRLDGQADQQISVSVVLNCTGSGALSVELIQNSSVLQGWGDITCGHPNQLLLSLYVGAPYSLHLAPAQVNNIQKYINYTLSVTLQ